MVYKRKMEVPCECNLVGFFVDVYFVYVYIVGEKKNILYLVMVMVVVVGVVHFSKTRPFQSNQNWPHLLLLIILRSSGLTMIQSFRVLLFLTASSWPTEVALVFPVDVVVASDDANDFDASEVPWV